MAEPIALDRKRGRWLRKLSFILAGSLVLLVIAYFVISSSAFVKGVILPRVGKSMNAQVTAGDVSLSPFSSVVLRQLKVQTTGTEPLLSADEIRVRYSLWRMLGGNPSVSELAIVSPVVNLVQNADGTSNADPLMKSSQPAKPAAKSGEPARLDLRNFSIQNGVVRFTRNLPGGGRELAELSGLNITLDRLANSQSGKLTLAAALKVDNQTNGTLQAKSAGSLDFAFDANLHPQTAKGNARLDVASATGPLAELAGLAGILDCDLTPTELKQVGLRFEKRGQQLGAAKISGPFDSAKQEGNLKFEMSGIDRNVLNLAGAPLGIDFGGTTLNAQGQVGITAAGSQVATDGKVNVTRFSVAQQGKTTPPIDLSVAYKATANNTDQTTRIETLTINGVQNQKPFLTGALKQPMTIARDRTGGGGDSAFELKLTDFNLGDWKALLGNSVSGGRVQLTMNVLSQQGGNQMKVDADGQIDDLAMMIAGKPFTQGQLIARVRAQSDGPGKFSLSECKLNLTQAQKPALGLTGSAKCDGTAFSANFQTELVPRNLTGMGSATPLATTLLMEGTLDKKQVVLKKFQLGFPPTKLAPKNEAQATGRLDTGDASVTRGNLSVSAATVDLTPLYDAFAGSAKPVAGDAKTTPASTPSSIIEPEAMHLPYDLTVDATVGKFFLREIAISDFKTGLKVAGNRIVLDPFQGALNGAPFKARADLDVGVKGYAYDLTLSGDRIPIEPVANTFSPESRDQYKGVILASAQIKGAGVTGAGLKANLNGTANLTLTNANLEVVGPKTKAILVPIATILRIDEITRLPLNWVDSQLEMGAGKIGVKRFVALSEAFEAGAQGAIPIANDLNQSPLNLPLDFALRRSLAQKANLIPADAPTNTVYVALPKFATVTGTLGDPKAKTDKTMLAGLLLNSGLGIAEQLGVKVDGKNAEALKGIGNLLTGQKSTNTATNAPGGTNKPAPLNPLDLFRKPEKK